MSRKPTKFVGLHAHTGVGSPFDGLGYPQEHIDFILENGGDAWALTEHGNMNSFAHAYLHAHDLQKKGVDFKFIPGCEFYIHPDLDEWQRDYNFAREQKKLAKAQATDKVVVEDEDASKRRRLYDPVKRRHHMVVLAKSSKGLKNLFTLVSRGFKEGQYRFPRIDAKMLKEHGEDLIISTACIAGLPSWVVYKNFPDAGFEQLTPDLVTPDNIGRIMTELDSELDPFIDAVGEENFFLEIQFNKLAAQHLSNKVLMAYAKQRGIPLIATADSHYPRPDLWKDRELYKKLGWLNYKDYDPSQLPQGIDDLKCELYPKNADQMWDEYKRSSTKYDFYDDDVVCAAIERTHDVAHELIGDVRPDTGVKLPSYVVPEETTAFNALVDLCKAALIERGFAHDERYVDRLTEELTVIKERDFAKYFLTMKKIQDIAMARMLTGPGRGSAAGSLINYLLGITQVDPLKYGLLFSRFISRYRKEMPDIDGDYADRDGLVNALKAEFGDSNVLPISNYNTFQLKSLIKDVSRFYGIDFQEVNKVTVGLDREVRNKVLGKGDDKNLFQLKYDDCIKYSKKFKAFIEKYPHVGVHIKNLFKENKAIGRHAGGVIVSEDIESQMPVIKVRGEQQTPWVEGMHYKHLEEFGWIKFDLLGLSTLRIITRAIELILTRRMQAHGRTILTLDDGTSRKLFGDDVVVLSSGSTKLVKDLQEDDDVVSLRVKTLREMLQAK